MKQLIALFFAIILFTSCADPCEKMADEVMADIQNGELRYMRTATGPLLYDPKHRISHRLLQHILKMGHSQDELFKVFDMQPRFFQLPNISSYTRTKTTTNTIDLSIPDSTGAMTPEMFPEFRAHYRVQSPLSASNVQVCLAKTGRERWEVIAIIQE